MGKHLAAGDETVRAWVDRSLQLNGLVLRRSDAQKANLIFEQTALSSDDVVAEKTVDLVVEQLQQATMFFRERVSEGFFGEESVPKALDLADTSERLANAMVQDFSKEIEFRDEAMPAYLATAHHLDRLAEVLRGLELYPEWQEYYDDMARKLNEYANGLRLDPESSFRAI